MTTFGTEMKIPKNTTLQNTFEKPKLNINGFHHVHQDGKAELNVLTATTNDGCLLTQNQNMLQSKNLMRSLNFTSTVTIVAQLEPSKIKMVIGKVHFGNTKCLSKNYILIYIFMASKLGNPSTNSNCKKQFTNGMKFAKVGYFHRQAKTNSLTSVE